MTEQHGMSGTRMYRIWTDMIARCHCETDTSFKWYGAKGVSVCQRWRDSFTAFLADMGERPSPSHSIDRIDNNGCYSPDNCRWATKSEQNKNTCRTTQITFNGKTKCLADWSSELGVEYDVLRKRLKQGWDVDRALSAPVASRKRRQKA